MTTPFEPLFPDVYADDNPCDWSAFAAAGPPWSGAILKATQGTTYSSGEWLKTNWLALATAHAGHGTIRGAYHYAQLAQSGKAQALFYLQTVAAAGGFKPGDLWPIVDVESADVDAVEPLQLVCVEDRGVARDTVEGEGLDERAGVDQRRLRGVARY